MCRLHAFGMERALRISQTDQHYSNLTGVADLNHVEKNCLVCDSVSTATTFTTEACQETFKIQIGSLTCDSENALYLLNCKVCGEVPYAEKVKNKFCYRLNNQLNQLNSQSRLNGIAGKTLSTLDASVQS